MNSQPSRHALCSVHVTSWCHLNVCVGVLPLCYMRSAAPPPRIRCRPSLCHHAPQNKRSHERLHGCACCSRSLLPLTLLFCHSCSFVTATHAPLLPPILLLLWALPHAGAGPGAPQQQHQQQRP